MDSDDYQQESKDIIHENCLNSNTKVMKSSPCQDWIDELATDGHKDMTK